MENGHWYAFPYPPLLPSVLAGGVARGYRPEAAVAVVAAAVNALEVLVVFGIARAFKGTIALAWPLRARCRCCPSSSPA
jgi:hypothetical protein